MTINYNEEAVILLDHGSGGVASRRLIEQVIASALHGTLESDFEDSSVLPALGGRLAYTTDSFVVSPVEFLNGSIGKIAVCGTVNDLLASGATPRYLSLALILEEGFSLQTLRRILADIRESAIDAGVKIVCGDTKVVEKGALDRIVINTSGIGVFADERPALSKRRITPGDRIILSTYAGDHGIHILSMREGLGFERNVPSDCAALNAPIGALRNRLGDALHCVRDVTRGGIGTILSEIADSIGRELQVDRADIPQRSETIMAAEMLGIDPLHLANEGCFVAFVEAEVAGLAVEILHEFDCARAASIIGQVSDRTGNAIRGRGGSAPVTALNGRVLPRLC